MQYSVVSKNNLVSDARLDAEAYLPLFFEIESQIKKHNFTTLGQETSLFVKGIFDIKADSYINSGGVPFVRIGNLKDMLIAENDIIYIPENENSKNKKTFLKREDIILSKTAYPAASLINLDNCNTSQDTIAVKLKANSSIDSHYLVLFLNSKYGFSQMKRWFTGNIQMHLNLTDGKSIKVPILSKAFQYKLKNTFEVAINQAKLSKLLYSQAEQLLLSELGLLQWKPKHELAYVENFSVVFETDRFDAEYFQPKFEEIIDAVKKYKSGFDLTSGQFKQNKKTFKIELNKKYQYVEIGCLSTSDGSIWPISLLGSELPANAKIKLNKDDVVVSKVRPYRGAIGIIDNENYVGSGAFTVLQEDGQVNKETLFVFLRLKPMLDFSLKFNTGTSYPTITDSDILNFPLPIIDTEIQKKVKEKITEMYDMKKKSKTLLDIAKRSVELAIDTDEQEAEKWIQSKIQELGMSV